MEEGREVTDDDKAIFARAERASSEALDRLFSTPLTTMAGAQALIRYSLREAGRRKLFDEIALNTIRESMRCRSHSLPRGLDVRASGASGERNSESALTEALRLLTKPQQPRCSRNGGAKRRYLAPPDETKSLTFAAAAVSYLQAERSKLFVKPLLLHFGKTPLANIGQAEIDAAAAAILPNALPQTRNRSVYTPTLAIMRHVGVIKAIKRPKWTGGCRLDWLRPDDSFKLLEAASATDKRLGALMTFLLYAGPRLSEALRLRWADIDLRAATALLRQTKNGEPIALHLLPAAVAALANLDKIKRRIFGISKCARLYALLDKAEKLSGIILPPGSAFHMLRHSHAMWRRLFTGADTAALVASGLWKSRNAAGVCEHLDISAESRKSDLFPTPARAKGGH
jgi:integrase